MAQALPSRNGRWLQGWSTVPEAPAGPGTTPLGAGSWLPDIGKRPDENSYCVLGTMLSGPSL